MRLGSIVLDSDDIDLLSSFYEKLLGWNKNIQIENGQKWITVVKKDYTEIPLVFQYNPDYVRPKWPTYNNKQQQMIHLDFYVSSDNFQNMVSHAVSCGAEIAANQFSDDWKVMLDLSGHPFCIIPIPEEIYNQRYKQ